MMERGFVCAAICAGAVSVSNAQEPEVAAAAHRMTNNPELVWGAETRHFAHSKGGAIVQVHGNGPFTLTYVNPADDPRKAPPAR